MSDQISEVETPADGPLLAAIKEFHERSDRGEQIDRNAFVRSHPDVSNGLETYFRDLNLVEEMAGPTSAMQTSVVEATVVNGLVAATESTGSSLQVGTDEPAIDDSGTKAGTLADATANLSATGVLPDQFGRYRILKELGRGAMGAVYLAQDEQLQRKVALKVPKFPDGMNSELLERFYREARAAGNLRHPGICPVYDVGEIDGQHFITMAYIEGRPLRSLTESGRPQDITLVADIIQKIAEAMAVAHKQGVIHRDLKPANVMLDTEGQPVVMDFGLARRSVDNEEKLTQTGMVLGSPAYMSPEQVDSDNDRVGPPADIYTLGVIFYELLTGGLPFQGGLMSILRQISMDQPRPIVEIRDDVDSAIQELCLRMLAKDAQDRPASMLDVARQLSDWLEGRRVARGEAATLALSSNPAPPPNSRNGRQSGSQPVTAIDSKASSDSVDSGRKRKLLLAAGLGGMLLLVASLTFFVRLGKHDVKITVSDPSIQLSVDEEVISVTNGEETVRLSAGLHKLQLQAGNVQAMVDSFVVSKDGKTALQVVLADGRFDVFSNGKKISQDPLVPDNDKKLARTDTTTKRYGGHAAGLARDSGAPPLALTPFDAAQARAHQEAWAGYLGEPVEKEIKLPGDRTLSFALIPPGTFWMGSTDEEIKQREREDAGSITADNYPTEAPRHRVTISKPFAISRFEVTRGDFRSFVESTGYKTEAERDGKGGGAPINGKWGTSPNILWNTEYGLKQTDEHPVVQVSWYDAIAFCEWLSTQHNATFFLPTEAQWEYACRAGTETAWHSGDDPATLEEVAWYRNHGNGRTHPVGELKPNAWGLHDVHGNAFEWCADTWAHDYYASSPDIDPTGPETGALRVLRGGCWVNGLHSVNSSYRGSQRPNNSLQMFGFRVAMSSDPTKRAAAKAQRKAGPTVADGSPGSAATTPLAVTLPTAGTPSPTTVIRNDNVQIERRLTLKGHDPRPFPVAFSRDGMTIASGGIDENIRLWNAETGELRKTLISDHTIRIDSFDFSPDGLLLAAASWDGTVRIWNIESGSHQLSRKSSGIRAMDVAFSPDGSKLACGFEGHAALWDVASGKELHRLEHHGDISSVAFTADGSTLVTASSRHVSTIKVWDVASGELKRTIEAPGCCFGMVLNHVDGIIAAGIRADPRIMLWDLETGRVRSKIIGSHPANCLAFSPDGSILAAGDLNAIILRRVADGEKLAEHSEYDNGVTSIAFNHDGSMLAAARNTVEVWDVSTTPPDASGGWALQFGDKTRGNLGAGFGFVVRETPIAHDQDFTIEFWCRLTAGSKERSLWHPPFSMGVLNRNAVIQYTPTDNPENRIEITGPEIIDRWVHQALVVEGNEMRLYVDGVLSGSELIPNREDTATDMPHFGLKAVGELDEVRISNVARYGDSSFTPESRFVPDEVTIGLFHLDEGQGTDLIDSSGHTVGTFATGSEGYAKLNWVKADGPTAADSKSRSVAPTDEAAQAKPDP